jgi:hypothetical protein
MTERPEPRWTNKEFDALVEEADEFTLAIKGHQAVMQVLDLAIGEALTSGHTLEIASLSAGLKIDLAVALGVVKEDDGPFLRKINTIRNTFAHAAPTALDEKTARDFFNSWPERIRYIAAKNSFEDFESPREVLARGIDAATAYLEVQVAYLRDGHALARIAHEIAQEALAGKRQKGVSATEETETRIAREREKRKEEGRL